MLNSIELVLMLLSMFTSITKENRQAVAFLFEVILSYDMVTGQFGSRVHSASEVQHLFEPLAAMALYHGVTYKVQSMKTISDAHAILHTILDPIFERLNKSDLDAIRQDMVEAIELTLFKPLHEVRELAKQWNLDSRKDPRFDGYLLATHTEHSTRGEGSAAPVTTPVLGTHGKADNSAGHKLSLSNPKLDGPRVAAILAYSTTSDFAAIPTKATLERCKRVEKRQLKQETEQPVDHAKIWRENQALSNQKAAPAKPSNTNALGLEVPAAAEDDPESDFESLDYDPYADQEFRENETCIIRAEVERCMDYKFPAAPMTPELAPSTPGLSYASAGTTPGLTPLSTPKTSTVDLFEGWAAAWEKEQLSMWSSSLRGEVKQPDPVSAEKWADAWESEQLAKWNSALKASEEEELRVVVNEELFANWADEWEAEQLSMWSAGLRPAEEEKEKEEAVEVVYAGWADAWEKNQLESWSAALRRGDSESILDEELEPEFEPMESVDPAKSEEWMELREAIEPTQDNLATKLVRMVGQLFRLVL